MTSVVYCDNATKRYGQQEVLHQLSLDIDDTGIVGILGPNGAGKSTLFRMLTGITQPTSGTVRVMGKAPNWQTNNQVAYLPDRARWYTTHTVERAFDWAEGLYANFDVDLAKRMADWMGLSAADKVSGMSRGEEARLMLVICLARKVPLVILDEPFAGIDVVSRERIIAGIIDFISDRSCTLLVSTHEIYEAESLFDRAVFLKDGGVALDGDVDALREKYGSMQETFRTLYR